MFFINFALVLHLIEHFPTLDHCLGRTLVKRILSEFVIGIVAIVQTESLSLQSLILDVFFQFQVECEHFIVVLLEGILSREHARLIHTSQAGLTLLRRLSLGCIHVDDLTSMVEEDRRGRLDDSRN